MRFLSIILNYCDIIGPLIALSVFLFNIKKVTKELWLVLIFCGIQVLLNALASYIEIALDGVNYWVYKINTIFSFIILIILFSKYLVPFPKHKQLFVYLALSIFLIIFFFTDNGFHSYNSHSAAMSSIIIVAYCLYFFYTKLLRSSPEESVPSTIIFWCIIGIFTYYAGAFFIFISYKYLIISDVGTVGTLWKFHNLLLLICSFYISYGVLCKESRRIL